MIGSDSNVGRAVPDHPHHRREHAADGGHLMTIRIFRGRQRIVVAEEFVSAINQVNVHDGVHDRGSEQALITVVLAMRNHAVDADRGKHHCEYREDVQQQPIEAQKTSFAQGSTAMAGECKRLTSAIVNC